MLYKDALNLGQLILRWCPTAHTFIAHLGEFTISLEDVSQLYLLRICDDDDVTLPL